MITSLVNGKNKLSKPLYREPANLTYLDCTRQVRAYKAPSLTTSECTPYVKSNMAAFMARRCALSISKLSSPSSVIGCLFSDPAGSRVVPFRRLLSGINTGHSQKFHLGTAKGLTGALSATVAGTVTFVWVQQKFCLSVAADDGKQRVDRPAYTPARSVRNEYQSNMVSFFLYKVKHCH